MRRRRHKPRTPPRASDLKYGTRTPTKPGLKNAQLEEDAWLEVSLNDNEVHFGRAEVNEAVEEIVGLCSEYENFLTYLSSDWR